MSARPESEDMHPASRVVLQFWTIGTEIVKVLQQSRPVPHKGTKGAHSRGGGNGPSIRHARPARVEVQGCRGCHGPGHAVGCLILSSHAAQHLAPIVRVKVRRELRVLPPQAWHMDLQSNQLSKPDDKTWQLAACLQVHGGNTSNIWTIGDLTNHGALKTVLQCVQGTCDGSAPSPAPSACLQAARGKSSLSKGRWCSRLS